MTTNPLLSKIQLPGETFQLPSQGIFYVNGELDELVKNGEVEVFAMTTIDEIIFQTPDKLLSGKAIVDVFQRCIPQVVNPMKLLAKDVDFLLVCLRLATFGPTMDVKFTHTCNDAKPHHYDISIQDIIKSTNKFDPTLLNTQYHLSLPNGQQILINPMIYEDVLKMYDIEATKKTETATEEQLEELLIDMMCGIIKSVDDITDSAMIREWLKKLNLGWKRLIEQKIEKISDWGVNYETHHQCKDCGEQLSIRITANPVDFFFQL